MHKYLFIAANECPWGGSEVLWSKTAERLVATGNEVRVSARHFSTSIPVIEHLRSVGCRIFYRQLPSLLYRVASKVFPLAEYYRRHMQSAAADVDLVVISQGSNQDGLPWMEEARALGHKYAVIVQGASELFWPDDEAAQRLARCYEHALRAYFVSQSSLDLSRRQFGTTLDRACVIRNPFNVRYDARTPWPDGQREYLSLACIGRLEAASKGQDLLLEVLNLPHWRQRKIQVSLIGNGIHERILRYMAERLTLTNVNFLGHIKDIEQVWGKHHALILPSRFEGMPLVVVEAMLCARPCIATDVGGNRDLVRDGVNGFLATAPTVGLIDEAMNRAWQAREQLRDMGQTAAYDVRQWVCADPTGDFVRELTSLLGRKD